MKQGLLPGVGGSAATAAGAALGLAAVGGFMWSLPSGRRPEIVMAPETLSQAVEVCIGAGAPLAVRLPWLSVNYWPKPR